MIRCKKEELHVLVEPWRNLKDLRGERGWVFASTRFIIVTGIEASAVDPPAAPAVSEIAPPVAPTATSGRPLSSSRSRRGPILQGK